MISSALGLIFGFAAKLILGWLSDRRAAQAQRELGASQSDLEGLTDINERARAADQAAVESRARSAAGGLRDRDAALRDIGGDQAGV